LVFSWKNRFKGPKKATPYAAGVVVKEVVEAVKVFGLKKLMFL
jgi:ribosomal protein S11